MTAAIIVACATLAGAAAYFGILALGRAWDTAMAELDAELDAVETP